MTEQRIVVVGAGVIGLTSALLLCHEASYEVTVVAEHMPGDYHIEYASPWAGANYKPVSANGTKAAEWDKNTWPYLQELAKNQPEAGLHFQKCRILNTGTQIGSAAESQYGGLFSPDAWWKRVLPDVRECSPDELREGVRSATEFTSVCINTAIYLPYLASRCLKAGVKFERGVVRHIQDAARLHASGQDADIIVNCSGLGAKKMGGVEDKTVVPARGQVVLVRNKADAMYTASAHQDSLDELTYVMTRAAGGGTILGGSYQKDNWESQPDPNLALRIMKRAVQICPQLTDGSGIDRLEIIRHGVGLRPFRTAGPRIEKEQVNRSLWLVHNYGHGGYGYQSSYGCAQEVVQLVKSIEKDNVKPLVSA